MLAEQTLRAALGDSFQVRGEQPFALDDISQPQPDISVVRGSIRDYIDEQPSETPLLVGGVRFLPTARSRTRSLEARNAVAEYWILDLKAARLEVHRDPAGSEYLSKTTLGAQDAVFPLCAPDAAIAVADLLP